MNTTTQFNSYFTTFVRKPLRTCLNLDLSLSFTYYNNYFFKLLMIFLLGIFLPTNFAAAQEVPSDNQAAKQNIAPKQPKVVKPLPKASRSKTISAPIALADIAKTSTISYYPKAFKVQQKKLDRKYYNNNIFDIDESDNPFALPIEGRKAKRKLKENNRQNPPIAIKELFSTSSENSQRIPQWLIFILLGLLSFMTILVTIYRKDVNATFMAFLNTSPAKNNQRNQNTFLKIESFSSYILFVWSMGTFCFLIPQILVEETTFNSFGALLLCIGGIAGIYVLKHLQLRTLSFVLPFPQEISAYNFAISNTNKVLGYLLIPILFLLAYSPENAQTLVLYASFTILAFIYLYRTLKGLSTIGSIILFHKFHFFIYLCAVEIAPILILLKLLSIL